MDVPSLQNQHPGRPQRQSIYIFPRLLLQLASQWYSAEITIRVLQVHSVPLDIKAWRYISFMKGLNVYNFNINCLISQVNYFKHKSWFSTGLSTTNLKHALFVYTRPMYTHEVIESITPHRIHTFPSGTPAESIAALMPSPAATPTSAIRLWPQAWPIPGRASYSQSTATWGLPLPTVARKAVSKWYLCCTVKPWLSR